MSINVNDKNLGHATAYAYYKAGGGTMTEAEFTEFMADFGTASQTAVEAAQAALASKNAAQTAATTATNKASEATTAAQTATSKAAEASTSASTATSAKDTAVSASQTATTKAGEATTAAATATSAATTATTAKDDAVSAKTAAQTAQTGAETAAASVQSSAAQIATNAEDISQLMSDLTLLQSDVAVKKYNSIAFTEESKKLISGSGNILSYNDANYCVTSFIPVTSGEKYYITASANYSNCLYAWYTAQEVFISGRLTGGSGGTTIKVIDEEATAPNNASYLVIAHIKPYIAELKVFDGYENNLEKQVDLLNSIVIQSGTVTLNVNGDNVTVFDDNSGMYLVADMKGSANKGLNFDGYYKSDGTLYKTARDDICPLVYDGSYRCGNHGNQVVIEITAENHRLTESDIGKIILASDNTPYVIVTIIDSNKFWIINDSASQSFITAIPGSPLTGDNINISFTSGTLKQLTPGINNIYQKVYVDSAEISGNGIYNGINIAIVEKYYSIDTVAMLTALKENVGSNTITSYFSDALSADLLYATTYIIGAGLAMYVSSTLDIIRDGLGINTWGIVQSQVLSGSGTYYYYISDTSLTDITAQSNDITVPPSIWSDENFPPYKFFQFVGDIGFALVYDLQTDLCKPNIRKSIVNTYACSMSTKKMYPYVKRTSEVYSSGDVLRGGALRMPISKSKPFVMRYIVGSREVLEIDTFTTGLNTITIPKINGKEIEVIHASNGVEVIDNLIYGNQISIKGKGSVSLLLK